MVDDKFEVKLSRRMKWDYEEVYKLRTDVLNLWEILGIHYAVKTPQPTEVDNSAMPFEDFLEMVKNHELSRLKTIEKSLKVQDKENTGLTSMSQLEDLLKSAYPADIGDRDIRTHVLSKFSTKDG